MWSLLLVLVPLRRLGNQDRWIEPPETRLGAVAVLPNECPTGQMSRQIGAPNLDDAGGLPRPDGCFTHIADPVPLGWSLPYP